MNGYVMGKMIHFKSGVEPIHITAVTHASIVLFGFTLVAQLGGAYRGAPRQPSSLLWLLFHSLDLANTGVIPPGNMSISTVHLRAWEMMTNWVNRFRGTHKI